MVEIIDILYNLKIKEGEKHTDFQRFHLLLSRIESLTNKEKTEIIDIDEKFKVHTMFNEVFIKNHKRIRMEWFCHNENSYDFFIIEVDKNKSSKISSYECYEDAENIYFEKFNNNNESNFVLTHIEKPNFKRVCTAYASYVLVNHDYLNDWYKIAKDLLSDFNENNNSAEFKKYNSYIQSNLKEQLSLLNKEIEDIAEYSDEEDMNIEGYKEWVEHIKEKLVDIGKIAVNQATNKKTKNKFLSWLKG